MNTHADKTHENKNQTGSHTTLQKRNNGLSSLGFVDNRPERVAQRKLQQAINNSSQTTQLKGFQETANNSTMNTIQRMVAVDLQVDDDDKKKIRAEGEVQEFKGGTSAGKYGWVGVTGYRSYYEITDGTHLDKGDVGPLNNDFTNPEAGHVLANQNGGDGKDTWNIFAQDGGTNNGTYKKFENKMRKDLNKYDDDDQVTFTSYLAGNGIEEGGKIADAGQGNGMDISSEDSD